MVMVKKNKTNAHVWHCGVSLCASHSATLPLRLKPKQSEYSDNLFSPIVSNCDTDILSCRAVENSKACSYFQTIYYMCSEHHVLCYIMPKTITKCQQKQSQFGMTHVIWQGAQCRCYQLHQTVKW